MIKKIVYLPLLTLLLMNTKLIAQPTIQWTVAANIMNDDQPSIGFAGMVSGINKDVLLVAGGANFPNGMPWQGGKKNYSNQIYVLEKNKTSFQWNSKNTSTLPHSIAYAGSATTEKGMVIAGGDNENGISAKANLLQWNVSKQRVEIKSLPDLPVAVTAPAMTANGNTVYALCGDEAKNSSSKCFYLNLEDRKPVWKSLPDAPIALANGMAVFQNKKLYLLGGRTKSATSISDLHPTVFAFDFKTNSWGQLADIFDGKTKTPFTAGAAFAVGANYIVLAGGDKGDVFHQIETYLSLMAKATSEEVKAKLTAKKNELVLHHQGFSTDVLLYDIKQNKWSKIGNLPVAAQVTTTAAKWGKDLVISSGEIRPGVRSPKIIIGKIK